MDLEARKDRFYRELVACHPTANPQNQLKGLLRRIIDDTFVEGAEQTNLLLSVPVEQMDAEARSFACALGKTMVGLQDTDNQKTDATILKARCEQIVQRFMQLTLLTPEGVHQVRQMVRGMYPPGSDEARRAIGMSAAQFEEEAERFAQQWSLVVEISPAQPVSETPE